MSIPEHIKQRAQELTTQIRHANFRYYALDSPDISDAAYDRLMEELKALETEYPELVTPESPTQRVGQELVSTFQPLQHRQSMLSLDNAFGTEELIAWEIFEPICSAVDELGHLAGFSVEERTPE